MFDLWFWLTLYTKVNSKDFEHIQNIIKNTELSSYLLYKNDFFIIKNKNNIISFWRIYKIENDCKELSSLRVEPEYRWQRIWIYLCEELIKHKKLKDNLFLATKSSLAKYYEQLWFKAISDNIPEKLIHTWIRAKKNGIEFVIMKYVWN